MSAGSAGQAASAVLSVEDLSVAFATDDGVVEAVRGVSFEVRPGEVLGVVGESGAGKSVTALAVMGLLPPGGRVEGSVRLGGRELLGMEEGRLAAARGAQMAMVFQDPTTALNPVRTVGWQIGEAVRAHHHVSPREASSRAVELLALMGIPDPAKRAASYPHELSRAG